MWIYWFLIAFPLCATGIKEFWANRIASSSHLGLDLIFYLFLLTFIIGFRYEVGLDWGNYLIILDNKRGLDLYSILKDADPLYALLNWIGANIGGGIFFVNVVCAFIFSYGLIALCRLQPRPWLAILVASPYLVIVVAMGYNRQGVSMGLLMMAIANIMKGNILKYIFLISVAALFHKSALILIPFAASATVKHRSKVALGFLVSLPFMFLIDAKYYFDETIKLYSVMEYESSGSHVRILMNALPALIFLAFKKRFFMNNSSGGYWVWMAWAALLFIPLLEISPSSTAIDRLSLYWIPLQVFVLSRLPDVFGRGCRPNATIFYLVSIYCVIDCAVWFYMSNFSFAWVPYRFYPFLLL